MSDKIPYSLLRIPISFVPSNPLKSVAGEHSTSEEEDKEKIVRSVTNFYQSVISLPPTKKKKSFSNSLAKLLEYNDEEEEDIKHIEPIEDTIKTGKNNEYEEKFNSSDDNKIWCVDCEVWVEKHLYQDHIHGIAHLVISKSFNDQSIPDPLTLNETNVGFRMLRDQGWRYEKGLGINEQGIRHPISTRLKNDRFGIGVKKTNQPPKR
ncbi:7630_t:CDS:2 [Rhizophagus irregularis]|nr:7630_t:CDS:2 [Rhizophagus irregularis]